METHVHSLGALFEQLGLDSSQQGIESFIAKASPIPSDVCLWEASIWSAPQATMLQQMKEADADWSEVVDQLDVMLR